MRFVCFICRIIIAGLKKFPWGWTVIVMLSLITIGIILPSCDMGVNALCYVFAPHYKQMILHHDFGDLLERGETLEALKVLREFEKWDKLATDRERKRRRKSQSKKSVELGYTYPTEYLFVYELLGDYDNALPWLELVNEIPGQEEKMIGGFPLQDYRGSYLLGVKARIDYKRGDRKKAFMDYVTLYEKYFDNIEIDPKISTSTYMEGIKYLITRYHDCGNPDCRLFYRYTSCFDYQAFLDFMVSEYNDKGCPEDFQEAMNFYQALTDEEVFAKWLEARRVRNKGKYPFPIESVNGLLEHLAKDELNN